MNPAIAQIATVRALGILKKPEIWVIVEIPGPPRDLAPDKAADDDSDSLYRRPHQTSLLLHLIAFKAAYISCILVFL